MIEIADVIVDAMSLIFMSYIAFRLYTRRPLTSTAKNEPPTRTNVDLAMGELLEKSRPSGGRVHIHEVEEVVRRRLG